MEYNYTAATKLAVNVYSYYLYSYICGTCICVQLCSGVPHYYSYIADYIVTMCHILYTTYIVHNSLCTLM